MTTGHSPPKRAIAVFCPELHERGGTERATVQCIRRWSEERDVHVYTTRCDAAFSSRVKVRTVRLPRRPHLLGWLLFYGWATSISRSLVGRHNARPPIIFSPGVNLMSADVTVAHIFFQQFREVIQADERAGLVVSPRLKRPGRLAPDWRRTHSALYSGVLRVAEKRFYRRSSFVFAVSPLEAVSLRAHGIAVSGITPNGVDMAEFIREERTCPSTFRVLCIGSEVTKKGLDILLQAVAEPDVRDRTSLTIVTRSENEGLLRSLSRSYGYERLTLVTEAVVGSDAFRDADIYVAPSREDSFNMPALEAMAAGVPVVLSTRCGFAAWAADSALLVEPTPREVGLAINKVMSDPVERRRLVDAGLELARSMTWDAAVNAMRPAFEALDCES